MAALGSQIAGLEVDKARLLAEVAELRGELARGREALAEERLARASVERAAAAEAARAAQREPGALRGLLGRLLR